MTTASERIAEWGLALRYEDVPASAREAALIHMLDGLGVALLAARRGDGSFAVEVARSFGSQDGSSVIGSTLRAPAPLAALANGVLVHALDYDDTHTGALVHPTAVVLPVALACGQASGASGADVLAAAVAGYETVIRLGAAVRHGFHSRGFHATSVCGVFAAALVAARLEGLDVSQTTDALGIAGSQASGSLEFLSTGSSTKQIHPGWAAHSGIMAARLARAGASGPATILEGSSGLFASYAGATTVDAAATTATLGEVYEIENTSFKPYPACQLSHASLDSLTSVRDGLDPAAIQRITFDVPPDAVPIICEPRATKVRPRTAYEAKFSLPWSAAALLLDGELGVETFDRPEREEVVALAERVEHVVTADELAPGDADARVEIAFDGGSRTGGAPGGGRPATKEAVLAKLKTHRLGNADPLQDAVLGLDDAPSLDALVSTWAC